MLSGCAGPQSGPAQRGFHAARRDGGFAMSNDKGTIRRTSRAWLASASAACATSNQIAESNRPVYATRYPMPTVVTMPEALDTVFTTPPAMPIARGGKTSATNVQTMVAKPLPNMANDSSTTAHRFDDTATHPANPRAIIQVPM